MYDPPMRRVQKLLALLMALASLPMAATWSAGGPKAGMAGFACVMLLLAALLMAMRSSGRG